MYTISITVDDVIEALADFVELFLEGYDAVRAQVNRVPQVKDPHAVITELLQVDLETTSTTYDPTEEGSSATMTAPKRVDAQIDFYGSSAGNWCSAVKTAFRTMYAATVFPEGIKPLYCSDGMQAPLITGEQQWESRWTLTTSIQYNPSVTVPQQFADEVIPTTVAADVVYDVQ